MKANCFHMKTFDAVYLIISPIFFGQVLFNKNNYKSVLFMFAIMVYFPI